MVTKYIFHYSNGVFFVLRSVSYDITCHRYWNLTSMYVQRETKLVDVKMVLISYINNFFQYMSPFQQLACNGCRTQVQTKQIIFSRFYLLFIMCEMDDRQWRAYPVYCFLISITLKLQKSITKRVFLQHGLPNTFH